MTGVRYGFSTLLAGGVTFGLFWIMTALIVVEGELIPVDPIPNFDIVRVERVERVERIQREPPERQRINEQPQPPSLPTTRPGPGEGWGVREDLEGDPFSPGRDRGRRLQLADGNATPLVRIPPHYPERAAARGIEGRVLIEFTIDRAGAVRDARVIAYEPSAIFNEAALEAVRQWRYSPRIVNGDPVEQRGIRISIPFRREHDEDAT